jgi:hypothetical protein
MGWVAKKALRVMREGRVVLLGPGEPVPEAATWNTSMYERTGYIELEEVRAQRLGLPAPAPLPASEPVPVSHAPVSVPADEPPNIDVEAEAGTESGEVVIKSKKKKGKEKCPGCGNMFKDLSRHKCKE